ncbi:hypothetical protein [Nitrosophilus alvini]|uniref:hypothetical protein n=1 Tax=Nitrosophilus alvini TaxID=2714855 RepID=UPI001F44F4DD|nr:hypothetical protein [Nitrosophilus alvini]
MPQALKEPLRKKVDIIIVALTSPLKIGIYENDELVKIVESNEKTSEVLPLFFSEILKEYDINTVFFAKGPGSFMSIKLVYIFLKTLSISRGIELKAADGFLFSKDEPIPAIGNLYFVKKNGIISTKKFEKKIDTSFELPTRLDRSRFSDDIEPLYILPAV